MHYRIFQPDDFDALYAIEELCFQPPFRFDRRYMRQLTEESNAATWIAEDGVVMAGFAIVEWNHEISGLVAYIQTIEVAPAHRGQGAGAELLSRLEASACAAGAVEIWLHVDSENATAIRLYRATGFLRVGRHENYYPHRRPAEIYSKRLAS
jgi:ribosomal-protein-alanine N-acetyltransferase